MGHVWAAIHHQFEALGNLIEARRFAEVPAATAARRDLANMLPQLAPAPGDSHGKLTNLVALVGQRTGPIEAAVAKADQASLETSDKKLKKTLRAVASLYPPAMLKPSMAAESDPAMKARRQ